MLTESRAEADSRLAKIRAELSAVRSEAAARARDLENQLAEARVSKSFSPRQETLAKVRRLFCSGFPMLLQIQVHSALWKILSVPSDCHHLLEQVDAAERRTLELELQLETSQQAAWKAQTRNEALEAQLAAAQEHAKGLEVMQASHGDLSAELVALQAANAATESQLSSQLRDALDAAEAKGKQVGQLEAELAAAHERAKEAAAAFDEDRQSLARKVMELEDQLTSAAIKAVNLQAETQAAREAAGVAEQTSTKLAEDLATAKQAGEELQAEVALAKSVADEQSRRVAELAAEVAAARQSGEETEAAAAAASHRSDQRMAELAGELAAGCADAQAQMDAMQVQLVALQGGTNNSLAQMRAEVEQTGALALSATAALAQAQSRVAQLEADAAASAAKLVEAEVAHREADEHLAEAESRATALEASCGEATAQLAETQSRVTALEQQQEESRGRLEEALDTAAGLEGQLTKAQDEAWESCNRAAALSDELAAVCKARDEVQSQLAEARSGLEAAIAGQEEWSAQLKMEIADTRREQDSARGDSANLQGKLATAEERVREVEEELAQAAAVKQQADAEMSELKEEIAALSEQLERLSNKLQQKESERLRSVEVLSSSENPFCPPCMLSDQRTHACRFDMDAGHLWYKFNGSYIMCGVHAGGSRSEKGTVRGRVTSQHHAGHISDPADRAAKTHHAAGHRAVRPQEGISAHSGIAGFACMHRVSRSCLQNRSIGGTGSKRLPADDPL